ncbi:MAG: RidA family protein, partial [Bacteroidetes bacterium]
MSKRINISTGTPWEDQVGFSRAVRVGNCIEVAGTAAADGDEIMFPYEPYEQTHYILLKIKQAIEDAGGS